MRTDKAPLSFCLAIICEQRKFLGLWYGRDSSDPQYNWPEVTDAADVNVSEVNFDMEV